MGELGRQLNLEWTTVTRNQARVEDHDRGTIIAAYSFVYSRAGPPYIELIESAGDSMWTTSEPYLHHMGAWTNDLATESEQLELGGWPRVAHGIGEDGGIARFAFHSTGYGPMIELLAPELQTGLERWIAGGELFPARPT